MIMIMESTRFDKSAFMGKITASVAHDLQNVLAIVKESSGLMQDILQIHQDDLAPDFIEKLTKSIALMQKQVSRGVGITSGLNAFAHTADLLQESIDVFEMLKRMILLSQRIFQRQGISVNLKAQNCQSTLLTDPLIFQSLIFESIQYLGDSQSGQTVLNITLQNNDQIQIDMNSTTGSNLDHSAQKVKWQALNELCQKIDAELEFSETPATLILKF
jgi:light-regulated signal transduction histidine kinase (bacteriophytochrome)